MLSDGYTDLPPGKIASVVTYLEMRQKPELAAVAAPDGISLRRVAKPDLNWYRNLFRRVGAEWLWFGRLAMTDEQLGKVLWDSHTEVFALSESGENEDEDKGLLELNCTEPNEVEIAYFGISSDLIGKGEAAFCCIELSKKRGHISPSACGCIPVISTIRGLSSSIAKQASFLINFPSKFRTTRALLGSCL